MIYEKSYFLFYWSCYIISVVVHKHLTEISFHFYKYTVIDQDNSRVLLNYVYQVFLYVKICVVINVSFSCSYTLLIFLGENCLLNSGIKKNYII